MVCPLLPFDPLHPLFPVLHPLHHSSCPSQHQFSSATAGLDQFGIRRLLLVRQGNLHTWVGSSIAATDAPVDLLPSSSYPKPHQSFAPPFFYILISSFDSAGDRPCRSVCPREVLRLCSSTSASPQLPTRTGCKPGSPDLPSSLLVTSAYFFLISLSKPFAIPNLSCLLIGVVQEALGLRSCQGFSQVLPQLTPQICNQSTRAACLGGRDARPTQGPFG